MCSSSRLPAIQQHGKCGRTQKWAPEIDAALRAGTGSRNPTEWYKKEDCWTGLRDRLPALKDPLPPEFLMASSVPAGPGVPGGGGADDYAMIEECMRISAAEWTETAETGRRLEVLHY